MSPIHVVQRPVLWLQAISRYRAHTSGGPNFMYDRCIDSIDEKELDSLDLRRASCLQRCGADSGPHASGSFPNGSPVAGFGVTPLPRYGLRRATLLVSGGPKSTGPVIQSFDKRALERELTALPSRGGALVMQLVGSGTAGPDIKIQIVDPEADEVCESSWVGEIWASGPMSHRATGIFRSLTADVFEASVGDGRCYLRTGDLGFVGRDQLFVVGEARTSIIDGRNDDRRKHRADRRTVSPPFGAWVRGLRAPVERLRVSGGRALVLARRRYRRGDRAMARALYEHEVSVSRVTLVKVGRSPRTSSGKVQRFRCRDLLLTGESRRSPNGTRLPPARRSRSTGWRPGLGRVSSTRPAIG